MLNNNNQPTLYDLLDLEHNATGAQILRRYRLLCEDLIADSVPLDDPRMIALNDAYRVLSNAEQRAEYDESLKEQGLYHAVERVDGRTELGDLFELDEVPKETPDDDNSDDEQLPNPSSRPTPPRTFNRAEKLRAWEVEQLKAREQSKQEARQYLKPPKKQLRAFIRRLPQNMIRCSFYLYLFGAILLLLVGHSINEIVEISTFLGILIIYAIIAFKVYIILAFILFVGLYFALIFLDRPANKDKTAIVTRNKPDIRLEIDFEPQSQIPYELLEDQRERLNNG